MKPDIQVEYNDSGRWDDAIVSTVENDGNVTLWQIDGETGALHGPIKSQRGHEPGNFRTKQ